MALSLTDEVAKLLYTKMIDSKSMSFENIPQPTTILSLLTMDDIMQLNKIATSKKLSSKPKEKFNMINDIMVRRGFKKLAAGTNRLVFKYMENQSFVVKVAFCQVALTDNIRELYNQHLLKPFVTKVFDVTPCGTVGLFERVSPISSREAFMSIAQDVYDIILNHLLGKYVIDDFGSKYFMNWGVRRGQFPVLLDFPYVFELDGSKLYCNKPDPFSKTGFCGGEIDYDDGFNYLVCQKCGKSYLASDLKLNDAKNPILVVDQKGDLKMNVRIERNGTLIQSVDSTKETQVYEKPKNGKYPYGYGLARREKNRKPHMNVKIGKREEVGEPITDNNTVPKILRGDGISDNVRVKKTGNKQSLSPNAFDDKVKITKVEIIVKDKEDDIKPEPDINNTGEDCAEPVQKEIPKRAEDLVEIIDDTPEYDDEYEDEEHDDEYYPSSEDDRFINMYVDTNKESEIIGKVNYNDPIVLEAKGHWRKVQYGDHIGYIDVEDIESVYGKITDKYKSPDTQESDDASFEY